jgi:hypothetical protein
MNVALRFAVFVFAASAFLDVSQAHADFWSEHFAIHPQSWQELFPYCIGAPQQCRPQSNPPPAPTYIPPQVPAPYYVIYRYVCRGITDNSDQGSCDVTTRAQSCQAAAAAQPYNTRAYDPCKNCISNVYDNTRYWADTTTIQGGPCQGW